MSANATRSARLSRGHLPGEGEGQEAREGDRGTSGSDGMHSATKHCTPGKKFLREADPRFWAAHCWVAVSKAPGLLKAPSQTASPTPAPEAWPTPALVAPV